MHWRARVPNPGVPGGNVRILFKDVRSKRLPLSPLARRQARARSQMKLAHCVAQSRWGRRKTPAALLLQVNKQEFVPTDVTVLIITMS